MFRRNTVGLEAFLEIDPPDDASAVIEQESPMLGQPEGLFNVSDQEEIVDAAKESEEADELIGIGFSLSDLKDSLEESESTGAISKPVASALESAVAHLRERVGLEKRTTFVVESFNGRQSRREGIRFALEGVTDTILEIIRKIVAWFKHIYEIVYTDIENVFRGAEATAERARRVQDRAVKYQAKHHPNVDGKRISSGRLTDFFSHNGIPYQPDEIPDEYRRYNSDINEGLSSNVLKNSLGRVIEELRLQVEKLGIENLSDSDALLASNASIKSLKTTAFSKFKLSHSAAGNEAIYYALPFGNNRIDVTLGVELGKYATVTAAVNRTPTAAPKEIKCLSSAQVIQYMKMVDVEMRSGIYRDFIKIRAQLRDAGKNVNAYCDKIMAANEKAGRGSLVALHFLKTLTASLLGLTTSMYHYNGVTNRNLIAYCEASIDSWK